MTYKTHINIGILSIASFIIIFTVQNIFLAIDYFALAILAALIPDIDCKNSFIRKFANPIIVSLVILFMITQYNCYNLIFILVWLGITLWSGHRNFSHSLLGMILFCIPFIKSIYVIPIMIGYASHLFADSMTSGGIPLLYPYNYRTKLFSFTTGGTGEGIIYKVCLIINASLIFKILYAYIILENV